MKKFWQNNKGIVVTVGVVFLLVVLTIFIDANKDDYTSYVSTDINGWLTAAKEDEYIVAVIAQTTCQYCEKYKPVISKLAKENEFKLFWFDVDLMDDEAYSSLTETYELEKYTGSTPYTFVVKNDEFVTDVIGYMQEGDTKNFLKTAKVIK